MRSSLTGRIFNFDVSGTTRKLCACQKPRIQFLADMGFFNRGNKMGYPTGRKNPDRIDPQWRVGQNRHGSEWNRINLLRADMGSGASNFILPVTKDPYDTEIDSGSGSVGWISPMAHRSLLH